MYELTRTEQEIDNELDTAMKTANDSRFKGMSYEEGVIAAINWLTGQTADRPMED